MESTPYQTPNLASILQTLSAYAPPQPSQAPDLEEGEYDPSMPQINPSGPHHAPPTPAPKTPTPQPPQGPPPSSITTWPPALRHITTHIASNPEKMQRIRHLIHTQHQHERQWWSGREDLVRKIHSREEGRKRLDSVLAAVGGDTTTTAPFTHADLSEAQELALYDRKVHRACRDMVAATIKELARMEVPSFCGGGGVATGKGVEEEAAGSELAGLRGRVVGLLEDLCGGEE